MTALEYRIYLSEGDLSFC